MRKIYESVTKEFVNNLPLCNYDKTIYVIQTEKEAEKACKYLQSFRRLGIDTETKPSFRKGKSHQVALLQVATDEACFLFRLNRFGIPPCLIGLLSDKEQPKIGLSLNDDIHMLRLRQEFVPGLFIDLQHTARELHIRDMSLQKLYANIFRERISKSQRLSNWEADVLSESQKKYASLDAWACLRLYDALMEMKQSGHYTLLTNSEEKESDTPDRQKQ